MGEADRRRDSTPLNGPRSRAGLADLHAAMQVAFGWDGSHLHRFVIPTNGTEYGICYYGGPVFRDDPRR
ncbi:MAG: IS1096 element passenger TnpR family protein [Acidimicrobiales bacterium]